MVLLAGLYIVPFMFYAYKYSLIKNFSLRNFVRTVNISGLVYLIFFIFMIGVVFSGPIIEDPQYPSAGETLIGGLIIGFLLSSLCCFLPLMIILNGFAYAKSKGWLKSKASDTKN